jgi:hypothetical protein
MATSRRARAAVLACGLAALTPPAGAAGAATGTVYGGATSGHQVLTVALTHDRSAVASVGVWLEGAGGAYLFSDLARHVRHARVSRNGGFAATVRRALPDGVMTYTVAGRVAGATMRGRVSGTLRLRARGTVAFPAQRWTAASAPGRIFAGRTSLGDPMVVELDRPGGSIAALHIPWVAEDADVTLWTSDTFAALPLDHGSFNRSWSDRTPLGDGDANLFDYRLAFSVSEREVRGTLQARVTQVLGDEEAGSADSRPIAFTARS